MAPGQRVRWSPRPDWNRLASPQRQQNVQVGETDVAAVQGGRPRHSVRPVSPGFASPVVAPLCTVATSVPTLPQKGQISVV